MGMHKCPGCGRVVRAMVRAILVGDGPARSGNVCASCERAGVRVVAVTRPIVENTTRAERATQREVLAPFVKRCEALAKAARAASKMHEGGEGADTWIPRAEAYEAIAHMLKEGRA